MSYEATADAVTLRGRVRPLVAVRALAAFLRNPNDTPQVFRVVRALDGASAERSFLRFCATSAGRRVLARQTSLADVLQDRASLARLPPDSLGRAFLEFVTRERIAIESLLAAACEGGIVDGRLDPARRLYRQHLHAMHDLLHVVTGYGTDELGETCLLAFTWRQNGTRGLAPLVAGLTARQLAALRSRAVVAAVHEGVALGAAAHWLAAQDWAMLIDRPIGEIRERLRIARPRQYLALQSRAAASDGRRAARVELPDRDAH